MKYVKLFENYKSQIFIEKLASLIIKDITKRTIKYKKWDEYNEEYSTDLLIYSILPSALNNVNTNKHGFDSEFKKFIKDNNKWLRILVEEEYNNSPKGDYTAHKYRDKEITLYYSDKDITFYYNSLNGDFSKIEHWNLVNFLNTRKNALEHELQHAYDDWRSNNKFVKYDKNFPYKGSDNYLSKYYKSSHEISAFFTSTISEIFDYDYRTKSKYGVGEYIDTTKWEDVLQAFMAEFPIWEEQSDKVKKRLTIRLYQIYDNKIGKRSTPQIDITDKVNKLSGELRKKYGSSIYIFYSHTYNYIKIDKIKVDTIEEEIEIYKEIIRLADINRKTITTNIHKGWTTNAIMKAKKYLKELGFTKNHLSNTDYRFMDDYIRYTKRKDK